MQGYNAVWMPGTDHAGIATQAVVEKRLLEEEKTRPGTTSAARSSSSGSGRGRTSTKTASSSQLKAMGCSLRLGRRRSRWTSLCAKAVRETFFQLFKDGLIYRGKRLVNWDAQLQTAVADDEVVERGSRRPPLVLQVSRSTGPTSRLDGRHHAPETMLGDTAVAVHPDDPRYQHLIGKQVRLAARWTG